MWMVEAMTRFAFRTANDECAPCEAQRCQLGRTPLGDLF